MLTSCLSYGVDDGSERNRLRKIDRWDKSLPFKLKKMAAVYSNLLLDVLCEVTCWNNFMVNNI